MSSLAAPTMTDATAALAQPADRAEFMNIWEGGLAFTSDNYIEPGSSMIAVIGGDATQAKMTLEVSACDRQGDGRFRIRCRLRDGAINARLVQCF